MEKELKAKLDHAILSALRWRGKTDKRLEKWAKDVVLTTELAVPTAKTVAVTTKSARRSERGVSEMLEHIKQTLWRSESWADAKDALAAEAITALLEKHLARIDRDRIDMSQLTLPGFEHLPKRIGQAPLRDATVKQFFRYADRYEGRATRDTQALEEIRAVVKKLDMFRITREYLTMAAALEIVDAPRGLAIVKANAD